MGIKGPGVSLREASPFRRYQGATNGGLPGVPVICPSLGMARGRSYCRHRAGLDVPAPARATAVIRDAGEGQKGRGTGPGGEAEAGRARQAVRWGEGCAHLQERREASFPSACGPRSRDRGAITKGRGGGPHKGQESASPRRCAPRISVPVWEPVLRDSPPRLPRTGGASRSHFTSHGPSNKALC